MARISRKASYPLDTTVTINDYVIGTDFDDDLKTKTFSVAGLTGIAVEQVEIAGGDRVINGGYYWVEDYDYFVWADRYVLNGVLYQTYISDTVTLAAAHATLDRIDVIVINSDGTITSVTGTASANPLKPDIDRTTQLEVTFVLVEANTTEPSYVANVLIYDEDLGAPTEYDTSTSGSVDFQNEEQASNGSKSAKYVNVDHGTFTSLSSLNGADISTIRFKTYLTEADFEHSIRVQLFDGVTRVGDVLVENGDYNFATYTTAAWQQVIIPGSVFRNTLTWGAETYDTVIISNFDGPSTIYIDEVIIQSGVEAPTPSDDHVTRTSELINDGSDGTSTYIEADEQITKTSELINDGADDTSTYVEHDELGAVATSNDYDDLDNKPASLFLGLYASLGALQTAHPTAIAGNYANVDTGVGSDAERYIWDVDDIAWVKAEGTHISNTSELVNDGADGTSTYAETDELPTNTSDLANDGADGTSTYAETDELPTNTSDLVNDGADGTSTYIEADEQITNTSELVNDGEDGVNPFLDTTDVVEPVSELLDVSVTWVSGLTFNVRADRFPVDGSWYSATQADVTLDAAHATLDRIDLLVANSGGTVGKITGVAAANPAEPNWDEATQYPIRFVLIQATDTTPVGYSNVLIFDEDTGPAAEWTFSADDTETGTSPVQASSGSTSIIFSGGSVAYAAQFTDATGIACNVISSMTFDVYLSAAFGNSKINIYFLVDGTPPTLIEVESFKDGKYGFDKDVTGSWQTITIDIESIGLPATVCDRIDILPNKTSWGGCFIDNVEIQLNTQIIQPPVSSPHVSKTSQLENDGADATSTYVEFDELLMENMPNMAAAKTTPIDADNLTLWDSVAGVFKKLTWANVKATLKTYFDTLYAPTDGGGGVENDYANLAALVADQGNQTDTRTQFVTDASGFTNISSGYAYVEYLGTTVGDETDYNIISTQEGNEFLGGYKEEAFSSLTTWTFVHNLGVQYPKVHVVDSNDEEFVPLTIDYQSTSTCVVTHSTAKTGKAIANTGATAVVGDDTIGLDQLADEKKKVETDATVTGTKSIDWGAYSGFIFTMTGNTTFSDSNLPVSPDEDQITILMTGDFAANLPTYYKVGGDTYNGTGWNMLAIECKDDTGLSEQVVCIISNLT